MKPLKQFLDIHTHNASASADAIICVVPGDSLRDDRYYSIGIHPWSEHVSQADIDQLQRMAALPNVVAIGETGLDKLRGTDLAEQERLLRIHISLSESLHKPLIIHAVRTFERLIAIRKELRPSMPWIIHGFRGKPQQAQQLLDMGFNISLGEHFNPATAAIIPTDRLYTETDTSTIPITEIIRQVSKNKS